METTKARWRRRALVASGGVVIGAFLLVIVGCGGAANDTTANSKPANTRSQPRNNIQPAQDRAATPDTSNERQPTGGGLSTPDSGNEDSPLKNESSQPTLSQTNEADEPMSDQPSRDPPKTEESSGLGGLIPVSPAEFGGATIEPKNSTTGTPAPARKAEAPLTAADASALGLRRIDGTHIILYTDLPPSRDVDELPKVFDLAVPQWCEYFGIPYDEAKNWRLIGSLMQDKRRFLRAKLLPAQMPPFLHGFQVGDKLWLYEQPTSYYRRHLLLHEGVHGFMNWRFAGCGPPWYMEGMAELLATHRWENGKLQTRYSPKSKKEAPHWGRVRIVKDDYNAGRGLPLREVLAYGPQAHLRVEPYGWSWAATYFLDNHPSYQEAFRKMPKQAHDNGPFFNEQIMFELGRRNEPLVSIEWQVFVANIEYGYDVVRSSIDFKPSKPLPPGGGMTEVKADRGWQSSGIRLERGKTYRLTAKGEFQIARDSEPWIAEADGVTIRYYRRRPLGRLLAAIEDWSAVTNEKTALVDPISVGRSLEWTAESSGDLFLQLNDSPAERDDNSGGIQVTVELVE